MGNPAGKRPGASAPTLPPRRQYVKTNSCRQTPLFRHRLKTPASPLRYVSKAWRLPPRDRNRKPAGSNLNMHATVTTPTGPSSIIQRQAPRQACYFSITPMRGTAYRAIEASETQLSGRRISQRPNKQRGKLPRLQ